MFNKESFIEHCQKLSQMEGAPKLINEYLAEQLQDRPSIISQLGKPTSAGIELLYQTNELTIINFVMAPGMELHAHNHNMWAVIGIYLGIEENHFYTRQGESITKQNSKSLEEGDTILLSEKVIHSVKNPTSHFTAGIHIYGGNFVEQERSQWDMESLIESPYDIEATKQVFIDANK
ncbi:MAG: hypothetical protein ACRBBR_08375 [Cellvibrionaceae bacterium]